MPVIDPENLRVIRDHRDRFAVQRRNQYDRTLHTSIVYFTSIEGLKELHRTVGKFLVEQSRA